MCCCIVICHNWCEGYSGYGFLRLPMVVFFWSHPNPLTLSTKALLLRMRKGSNTLRSYKSKLTGVFILVSLRQVLLPAIAVSSVLTMVSFYKLWPYLLLYRRVSAQTVGALACSFFFFSSVDLMSSCRHRNLSPMLSDRLSRLHLMSLT